MKKIAAHQDGSYTISKDIIAISDTHLFSKIDSPVRTKELRVWIQKKVAANDITVFIGDIFEHEYGKWGVRGTIDKSLKYLEKLLSNNPDKEIYYIYGNHDCRKYFKEGLEKLSEKFPNLKLCNNHLKIDGIFFSHGDLEMRHSHILYPRYSPDMQRRFIEGETEKASSLFSSNRITDLIIKKYDAIVHKPSYVAKKLIHAYDDMPEVLKGVHTFVTGHTHIPFFKQIVEFNGQKIDVHNTGTPRINDDECKDKYALPLKLTLLQHYNKDEELISERAFVKYKYMGKFIEKMQKLIHEREKPVSLFTQIKNILNIKSEESQTARI